MNLISKQEDDPRLDPAFRLYPGQVHVTPAQEAKATDLFEQQITPVALCTTGQRVFFAELTKKYLANATPHDKPRHLTWRKVIGQNTVRFTSSHRLIAGEKGGSAIWKIYGAEVLLRFSSCPGLLSGLTALR